MHGTATGYVDDIESVVVRRSRTTWQSAAAELQKAEDSSTPEIGTGTLDTYIKYKYTSLA